MKNIVMEFQLLRFVATATLMLQSLVLTQPIEFSAASGLGSLAVEGALGGAGAGTELLTSGLGLGGAAGAAHGAASGGAAATGARKTGTTAVTAGTHAVEAGANAEITAANGVAASGEALGEKVVGTAEGQVNSGMQMAGKLATAPETALGGVLDMASSSNPVVGLVTAIRNGVEVPIDLADRTSGQFSIGVRDTTGAAAGAMDSGLAAIGVSTPVFQPMSNAVWQITENGREAGFDAARTGVNGAFMLASPEMLATAVSPVRGGLGLISNGFRFGGNGGGFGGRGGAGGFGGFGGRGGSFRMTESIPALGEVHGAISGQA